MKRTKKELFTGQEYLAIYKALLFYIEGNRTPAVSLDFHISLCHRVLTEADKIREAEQKAEYLRVKMFRDSVLKCGEKD